MIIIDINFFTTKNLIKENDCSCDESIAFLKSQYGTKNIDASKVYDDILSNPKVPERWKKDTILYRTEYNSLKAYVDTYKRSKIVETNSYRLKKNAHICKVGNLKECQDVLMETLSLEYSKIEDPIMFVGIKEGDDESVTYIKYSSLEEIPDNISLQLTSYDNVDSVKIKNKSFFEEEKLKIKENILNRISQSCVIERRYTDETNWFDCWVKV